MELLIKYAPLLSILNVLLIPLVKAAMNVRDDLRILKTEFANHVSNDLDHFERLDKTIEKHDLAISTYGSRIGILEKLDSISRTGA